MDKQIRKRLEEAANNYAYITATPIKERWMQVSDIYRIMKNAHAKGAELGYKVAIADVLKFLDEERHNLVVALEDMTEECSPRHFAFYQRHYCLEKIISQLSKINKDE